MGKAGVGTLEMSALDVCSGNVCWKYLLEKSALKCLLEMSARNVCWKCLLEMSAQLQSHIKGPSVQNEITDKFPCLCSGHWWIAADTCT